MAFAGSRRFVGFGFGPIQAGLFLCEAQAAGVFARPFVVDIREDLVQALNANGGHYSLNIARARRVDSVDVGPITLVDSTNVTARRNIISAVAHADVITTALPSVEFYRTNRPSSPHLLLAEGLSARTSLRPAIVYCSENHRGAASLLREAVLSEAATESREQLQHRACFLDTVIGKMSGVITDEPTIRSIHLARLTPNAPTAYLVEEFNDILVSPLQGWPGALANSSPGIPGFREVPDLAPFEAAKLYGHNATHAMAGFIGRLVGLRFMSDLSGQPGAIAFLQEAFITESGAALIRRYEGSGRLFTSDGFGEYVQDLLQRMVNPNLNDTTERAARDPHRKLGWDDRLVGTIRLCLSQGVQPRRYAMGAAAALAALHPEITQSDESDLRQLLEECWGHEAEPEEARAVVDHVKKGAASLRRWLNAGLAGWPE